MWETQESTYCSANWGTEHDAHTIENSAQACETKCNADAGCLAISFSVSEGGKCVLCKTSTATSTSGNWQFYVKPPSLCYDGHRYASEACKTCSGPGPSQCLSCEQTHAWVPFMKNGTQGHCRTRPADGVEAQSYPG